MQQKIKVLQIVTGLGVGGAEKVVLELCKSGFSDDDIEMQVFSFGTRKDLLDEFQQNGVKTTFKNTGKNVFDVVATLKFLIKLVKLEQIDVIHAHMFHSLVFASLVKLFSKNIKVVFTPHSVNIGSKTREFITKYLRPLRTTDIVFSESQIKANNKKNTIIIPNGIDTSRFQCKMPKFDVFTFLMIGRIEKAKNHLALIPILKQIKIDMKYRILVVGDGILREEFEEQIKIHGFEEKIKILGIRADIPELCSKSHAFIMPSLWEGMPIALIEAGASGLPVISTPVGSIPTIINESNGYLAEVKDFPKIMESVLDNINEANAKGLKLQRLVQEKYDTKAMYKQHVKLYRSLS